MRDMEYEEIKARLSLTAPLTQSIVSRRTVLKAMAAGAAIGSLPSWAVESARAAAPIAAGDGVLVIVQLGGGNDGLNTVIPTGTGAYQDVRQGLAIEPGKALPLNNAVGLHPSLVGLQKRYRAGKVAIVQGVGYPKPDMSHFQSMATWMAGTANGSTRSGWLGRYLDGMANEELVGACIGSGVPLHLMGMKTAATSLPDVRSAFFGVRSPDEKPEDRTSDRLFVGVRNMGTRGARLPTRSGEVARSNGSTMALGERLSECYPETPVEPGKMKSQMTVAANLINANLGLRVIGLELGSFDTHSGQQWQHEGLLKELDEGIDAFFATISARFARNVTLMTFSEFGRRVEANGGGTDHGTAGPMFLIGNNVKGGVIGDQPSLTKLDPAGNLVANIDFRSVYANVLDKWLKADSTEILGRQYEDLPLFARSPGAAA